MATSPNKATEEQTHVCIGHASITGHPYFVIARVALERCTPSRCTQHMFDILQSWTKRDLSAARVVKNVPTIPKMLWQLAEIPFFAELET